MNAHPIVVTNMLRPETLATRLSTAEMCAVEAAAVAAGIRSEWLREAVLAHLDRRDQPGKLSSHAVLLAEIMGLRLMMLNLFPAAIPGLAHESVRQIMAFAESRKRAEAAKVSLQAGEFESVNNDEARLDFVNRQVQPQ
jgi:hypothetical protein